MSAVIEQVTAWPTVAGQPGSPPVIFEDRTLPHQPVLTAADGTLVLTCTCQTRPGADTMAITFGSELPWAVARAAYRQWHINHGELVQS